MRLSRKKTGVQAGAIDGQGLKSQLARDMLALGGFLTVGVVIAMQFDLLAAADDLAARYAQWPVKQAFGAVFIAAFGLTLYGFSRWSASAGELRLRKDAEERANRLALHDQLTGLPNRRHIKGVLNWHLGQGGEAQKLAVIALNIDGFRQVNDLHGRAVGDELLVAVGQLLNMRAGVDAFVARLGGDDFAVVLLNKSDEELMDWLSALLSAIEAPIVVANQTLSIGATLGVAMAPADGMEGEMLLRRADMALRRGKEKARGWFAFFKTGMDERAQERAAFEHDLWNAVRDDRLEPYFQPLVSLADNHVRGFEILARWPHERLGLVQPDLFIPVAEGAGLISDLTLNVLRKACKAAARWPGAPYLSINISPSMLENEGLPDLILLVLAENGFSPERLEIDVTEHALVADFATARAVLSKLKDHGVRIALDNFGTGHSSLRQLRELPFDQLKIDRSFVKTMSDNAESAGLVRAIVSMARHLDLKVMAEGVETAEQAATLAGLGCDAAQGHHFGKAAPASAYFQKKPKPAAVAAPEAVLEAVK